MKTWIMRLSALAFLLACGCLTSTSPEEHQRRADGFFQQGRYDASIVEYLNVLQAQPTNRSAQRNLGIAYYQTRDLDRAYPLLVRAARWNDRDLDVKIKLASLHAAAGSPQEAERMAGEALALAPDDPDALLVWVNAVLQNGRPAEALQVLLSARDSLLEDVRYFLTLGMMQAAAGDSAAALDALNRAVELAPARADVYLARGELLANLKRINDATADYERAQSLAPGATVAGLRYALHLKTTGNSAAARARLDRMLALSPDFVAARYERAALDVQQGNIASAQRDLEKILSIQPDHLPARQLRARLLLQTGHHEEALLAHQQLAARFPHAISAGMAAARLLEQYGNTGAALRQLEALLSVHPDQTDAMLMWAELSIARGDYPPALARLARLAEKDSAARPRALALTGLAHRRTGNMFAAHSTYEELATLLPGDPQPHYLAGLTGREAGRLDAAASSWATALELDPLHFPSLQGLVMLRLEQARDREAEALLAPRLQANGDDAGLLYLQAAVETFRGDLSAAERSLRRAIEQKPDFIVAYRDLGRLYVRAGRVEDALRKLSAALEQDPEDVTSLIMSATLLQQTGQDDEAIARYEMVLARNGDFVTALNNLAYLYALRGDQPERALQLAQRARERAPRDPAVADTLGMIALQRGMYRWAHTLLRECEVPLAHHPGVMHHLAQACLALGQEDDARKFFAKALASPEAFPGRAKAEALADVLQLPLETVNETHAARIASWRERMPSEPPVLARQAMLAKARGDWKAALEGHQQALDSWPEYVPSLVQMTLIQLQQGQSAAALNTVRRARALQPSSPALTHLLGRAAYQSGDYPWALGLFAEALNPPPVDADYYFHHALAALMTGRLPDAYASAIQALQLTRATDPERSRRQTFVEALSWYAAEEEIAPDKMRASWSAWDDDAGLRPLMQLARARVAGREAMNHYRALIADYPGWPLPQRDLVSLYIARGEMDDEVLQIARAVRERMPGNRSASRNHAIALAMQGPRVQAAFYLKQYLAEAPGDQQAAAWLNKIEAASTP